MTVSLVGAGPGDPGLLTRRGAELLGRADVVVYDRLIGHELLELAPTGRRADRRGQGPRASRPHQSEINAQLIELGPGRATGRPAQGGRPFVFGRGGEEAEALRNAGRRLRGGARGELGLRRPGGGRDPGDPPGTGLAR